VVVALIAGAAIAHATWNLTIKRARTSGTRFLWLTFLVGAVIFAPLGISSLARVGDRMPLLLALAVGSGILQLMYFLLLQRGYRRGDVSIVYPLARGAGPLLSVIFGIVLFGERPGIAALFGAGVIVIGVVVIGVAGGRATGRNWVGIGYGLLIGVAIAAYTLWDANAVAHVDLPLLGYFWVSLVVQLVAFAPLALRSPAAALEVARRHWAAVLVVGVLSPLAYVRILFAFTRAPVSIVAPAREVSVVLVALGGWLLLREPRPAQRLAGAAVVLCGVALLALG
jgi:drug/metabolite transporter (DMT)-like permease